MGATIALTGKFKLSIILSTLSAASLMRSLYADERSLKIKGLIHSLSKNEVLYLIIISQANRMKYFVMMSFPPFNLFKAVTHCLIANNSPYA